LNGPRDTMPTTLCLLLLARVLCAAPAPVERRGVVKTVDDARLVIGRFAHRGEMLPS
jgi:hypothetical protein